MNIYHGIEDFHKLPYAVVTSGTFDGVHMGHQQILRRLRESADKHGGETVLITYWPHPRLVLFPDQTDLRLLNTFEEKAELLREHGVDHLLRIPFTREFSQTTSTDFIKNILIDTIGTKKLIIGYDHRFGKNREGSFEHLRENAADYGFSVEEIPKKEIDNLAVSSTKIRNALLAGDMQTADHLLGRPYSLEGRVIRGERIGRMLGFPTANIEIDNQHKLIPADGSYAVTIEYTHRQFKGMLNIGIRPTVGGTKRTIEVHIFDFDQEIYGDTLKINFIRRIRNEISFNDVEALKAQLKKDRLEAIDILKSE
jgi:riboflavin kinase / FMN adenylyltransferase